MKLQHKILIVSMVLLLGVMSVPAAAQEATAEQKVTFRRLVQERDELAKELFQLDKDAAAEMKQGKTPVTIYARQVAAQDKLDLVRVRLEMMATRYGMDLPSEPTREEFEKPADVVSAADETAAATQQAFARGRDRAVRELQRETKQMLAQLDLEPIVKE